MGSRNLNFSLLTDDDLLQDLFFQVSQIKSFDPTISFNVAQTMSEKTQLREQAVEIEEDFQRHSMAFRQLYSKSIQVLRYFLVPCQSEVSSDVNTLGQELKSLFVTFLFSSVFRLLLVDAISIGRQWVAHLASDISNAALHVHDIAEHVRNKAEKDEFGRKAGTPVKCTHPRKIAEDGMVTASDIARGVQESINEKKKDWNDQWVETKGEAKQKLLTRMQEAGLTEFRITVQIFVTLEFRWSPMPKKILLHVMP